MKPTLANYLDFLTPWISSDLVSPLYLNRIQAIAERLPVLSLGSFECWLDANEPRVDFNVCINPRLNEQIVIRDWRQEASLLESDEFCEMRERIRFFCGLWSQKDFFLNSLLGELWQVYDIADPTDSQLPVPWIYITFLENIFDGDQSIKTEIIAKTLPLLDSSLPSELTNTFFAHLRSLPSSIRIGPIGIQKRNKKTSLRLFLEIKTLDEILAVLSLLQWPGNLDELRESVAIWTDSRLFLGLALDFDGTFQPKIGIECHFPRERLQPDLISFTQHLSELGVCFEAKKQAIIGWNGRFDVETKADFWSWPDRILQTPESIPRQVSIQRIANFVKLIFEPNKPLIAKVYPMFLRPVKRNR
ncbi:hypothetical protein [Runella aurantiaca]|uniref:Uncharacterized protein n=1 Tax=Runella aurantiaca TaxID=2282308 RepID=A0A369I790_9BACT|nr:hypothetical protein [Runella aurantiaca]RDB03383.1 hypothetical protein DVG78_23855 [Runella aurantiaca]